MSTPPLRLNVSGGVVDLLGGQSPCARIAGMLVQPAVALIGVSGEETVRARCEQRWATGQLG